MTLNESRSGDTADVTDFKGMSQNNYLQQISENPIHKQISERRKGASMDLQDLRAIQPRINLDLNKADFGH